MFSRKLTKFIAAGAAAIAVTGSSCGMVSATSSSSPAAPVALDSLRVSSPVTCWLSPVVIWRLGLLRVSFVPR